MKIMIITWIHIYSALFQVDPYLAEAIVQQESTYNPKATGLIKEVGLMQIRRKYLDNPDIYYNPRLNLFIGIKRLAELQRLKPRLGENWFCAWNLGPTGALALHKEKKLNNFKYCREVKSKRLKLVKEYNKKYRGISRNKEILVTRYNSQRN